MAAVTFRCSRFHERDRSRIRHAAECFPEAWKVVVDELTNRDIEVAVLAPGFKSVTGLRCEDVARVLAFLEHVQADRLGGSQLE